MECDIAPTNRLINYMGPIRNHKIHLSRAKRIQYEREGIMRLTKRLINYLRCKLQILLLLSASARYRRERFDLSRDVRLGYRLLGLVVECVVVFLPKKGDGDHTRIFFWLLSEMTNDCYYLICITITESTCWNPFLAQPYYYWILEIMNRMRN